MAKSGSYDPMQFYVRAKNDSDHYERIQVEVTPEMQAEMAGWVNSSVHNFESVKALARWCFRFGMEHLQTLDPKHPSHIAILKVMDLEIARSETRRKFVDFLDRSAKEAYELVGMGYQNEAARLVHQLLSHIRQLDPEDMWRQVYIDALKKKFGYLLKQGKVASLVPEDMEDLRDWEVM